MTVLLTRSLIDRAVGLDLGEAFRVLDDGFRAAAPAQAPLPARTDLPGPGTATCLMPGLLPGIPAYTVKVNAKPPSVAAGRGQPAVARAGDRHVGARRGDRELLRDDPGLFLLA